MAPLGFAGRKNTLGHRNEAPWVVYIEAVMLVELVLMVLFGSCCSAHSDLFTCSPIAILIGGLSGLLATFRM
jgi:hypothetical protein